MNKILRLASALVLLLLGLSIGAWILATQTGAAGQLGVAVFNDGSEQLQVALDETRLDANLLGGQITGLVLTGAEGGQELVRLDEAELALSGFPSSEGLSVERATITGLRLRLDDKGFEALEEQLSIWAAGSAEDPPAQAEGAEADAALPAPSLRLAELKLIDLDVQLQRGDWELTAPQTSLELSGLIGPATELDLLLDVAPLQARVSGAEALAGPVHVTASLAADLAAREGTLTIPRLSLKALDALDASLRGLRLSELVLQIRGLSASLSLGELAIDALRSARLGLALTKGSLSVSLDGSLTGVRVDALRFRSSELRLDAKGAASLSIGFSGKKLPYSLSGSFAFDPSRMSPTRCPRSGTVSGAFEFRGDFFAGEHHLAPIDLTVSREDTTTAASSTATATATPTAIPTATPTPIQRWRFEGHRLDGLSDWLSIPGWLCPPALPRPVGSPEAVPPGPPSRALGATTGT
jgi:hypothetical protein